MLVAREGEGGKVATFFLAYLRSSVFADEIDTVGLLGGMRGALSTISPINRPRRSRKNLRSRALLSSASTPPVTSGRQWQVGWSKILGPWITAPPFGSGAPNTSRPSPRHADSLRRTWRRVPG